MRVEAQVFCSSQWNQSVLPEPSLEVVNSFGDKFQILGTEPRDGKTYTHL